jgi:hypothetical protein
MTMHYGLRTLLILLAVMPTTAVDRRDEARGVSKPADRQRILKAMQVLV